MGARQRDCSRAWKRLSNALAATPRRAPRARATRTGPRARVCKRPASAPPPIRARRGRLSRQRHRVRGVSGARVCVCVQGTTHARVVGVCGIRLLRCGVGKSWAVFNRPFPAQPQVGRNTCPVRATRARRSR